MKIYRHFLGSILFTLLFIFGLSTLAIAEDVEAEMAQTEIMHTSRLPEGVIVQHNRVMLKKGYHFRRASRNRLDVISPLKGNVTGNIECRCRVRHGICRINSTPATRVYCLRSHCSSKCILKINTPEVTIMGGEQDDDGPQ